MNAGESFRDRALAALGEAKNPDANPSPQIDALRGIGYTLIATEATIAQLNERLGEIRDLLASLVVMVAPAPDQAP